MTATGERTFERGDHVTVDRYGGVAWWVLSLETERYLPEPDVEGLGLDPDEIERFFEFYGQDDDDWETALEKA